jgi:hypothetical protein
MLFQLPRKIRKALEGITINVKQTLATEHINSSENKVSNYYHWYPQICMGRVIFSLLSTEQ